MKKQWIFGLLGLSLGIASSYGQGVVNFSNYHSSTSPVITGAAGGLSLGGTYAAELYWFNGTTTDITQLTPVPSSLAYFGYDGPGQNTDADGSAAAGAGWFFGLPITLTGNAGTAATFVVYAFNNGSLAASTASGHGALFTMSPAVGASPVPTIPEQSFVITSVPEPTTLALAGLGGLASLVAFRRKQA